MNIGQNIDIIIDNFSTLNGSAEKIQEITDVCIESLNKGGKIMLCGNGGSAADAQHIAAELVVRYKKNRKAIPAIALTTDTSILTAIGNDFSAEKIFERQVEALGNNGDVLIAFTTSGNSQNILYAVEEAKSHGIKTIAITGKDGGKIKDIADITLKTPSEITNNIQEMDIAVGHIICEIIENSVC